MVEPHLLNDLSRLTQWAGHSCKGRGELITRNMKKRQREDDSEKGSDKLKADARAKLQLKHLEQQMAKLNESHPHLTMGRYGESDPGQELCELMYKHGTACLALGRVKQVESATAQLRVTLVDAGAVISPKMPRDGQYRRGASIFGCDFVLDGPRGAR